MLSMLIFADSLKCTSEPRTFQKIYVFLLKLDIVEWVLNINLRFCFEIHCTTTKLIINITKVIPIPLLIYLSKFQSAFKHNEYLLYHSKEVRIPM